MIAGPGNDVGGGGKGTDYITMGTGYDNYWFSSGKDVIRLGRGNDWGRAANKQRLDAGPGNDRVLIPSWATPASFNCGTGKVTLWGDPQKARNCEIFR